MQPFSDVMIDQLRAMVGTGAVSTDPAELSSRTRDCWPRLTMRERAGEELPQPGAVVWPADTAQTAALFAWATANQVAVVPYGGGGGVTGGASPLAGCLMLDTKRMIEIGPLDEISGLVTCGPGVIGQRLEEWLGARGWTLGHFPSSITVSSVGGFAASRSAGQASTKYGKFEDMVAGLEAVLPDGTVVRCLPQPASAAGPDLAQLLMGGEGTLGVITSVDLRIHPLPEVMDFRAYRLPSFIAGLEAIRQVLRKDLRPAVVRLYDEADTGLNHPEMGGGCLVVTVCEGYAPLVAVEREALTQAMVAQGGEDMGEDAARHWHAHRYDVSYRLAEFMKPGGAFGDALALDTCEVAGPWSMLPQLYDAVKAALGTAMDLVMCHASHAYRDGAALYFTFGAVGAGDEEAARQRYDAAWAAAMQAALALGATTTHHHGVGLLRAPYLATELGEGGMALLRRIKAAVDPSGIANPGKLGLAPPDDRTAGQESAS